MASTINADNGVVSGSSGVKTTADTSGVLALQSNGSTGVTLNTDLSVTFAGAQTLSAGTANGVTYLNGSKVLTSGSALTFDGTNFVLNNGSIRANNTLGYYTNLTATGLTNFATTMDFDSVGSYLFKIASSEQMRLTSTGLGIGTSSPNRLLSLYATQPVFQITNVASGNTQGTIQYQVSGGTDFILDNQGSGTGGNIIFYQAGVERYRFGTSGQLGVGGANYGTSGQVLTSGGSGAAPSWSTPAGGFSSMDVFTSSGTWSVPTGITKCKVTVTGAGGGADNNQCGGGGAGGTAISYLTLSGGSATITIGAGTSNNGGNSTFVYSGTTLTGNGGTKGSDFNSVGGTGGSASGGTINIEGGGGQGAATAGGVGGASFWGGGGHTSRNVEGADGQAYGSGAGGRSSQGSPTTYSGKSGVVVIEY